MKTISVSVIGSCPCRDLFEGAEEFTFHTDIRFVSVISMMGNSVVTKICIDDLSKKAGIFNGNWYKKNLVNDFNKCVFESLAEMHGDYLVVDLAESRLPLVDFEFDDGQKLTLTYSTCFKNHYLANLQNSKLKGARMSFRNPIDIPYERWEDSIKRMAVEIKKIFDEERIILIENMPANYYVDNAGCLRPYVTNFHRSNIDICELLLPKLYQMFKKECPKCKVIKMPKNTLGLQKHKWGNHPFHFTNSYYAYLLECVRFITSSNGDLDGILQKHQTIIDKEYNEAKLKSIKNFDSHKTAEIDYLEVINGEETLNALGRRKKARILFAVDKKHFFKNLKKLKNQK